MSSDNGIYIGYWNVDGIKVYSVAHSFSIDNLVYYAGVGEKEYTKYVNNIWGNGIFSLDANEAHSDAKVLENKYKTEYAICFIGEFKCEPPERVMNFIASKYLTKQLNEDVDFQTRSEENGIKYFKTLDDAFQHAQEDLSVWKISFKEKDQRIRLVRESDSNCWSYDSINNYLKQ